MIEGYKKKKLTTVLCSLTGVTLLAFSSATFAANKMSYTLKGDCAFLPAARATEFHGNADRAKLLLGMAGNQWVVFEKVLQAFNVYIGKGDGTEPAYRENPGWNLADLNLNANRIYTQMIPPGQIRKQIKSGCMVLGNDEERNFLPNNIQVDFDVFASTNYNLMQDLANNGFIDEAVPYIKNKLDLMVSSANGTGNPGDLSIGTDTYTGDADFDKQFDILMDLLSGDIIASNLDHINEGIHNAANKYMGVAHDYIRANDRKVTMTYTYADGTTEDTTKLASQWLQDALSVVAIPMTNSPGAERLVSLDAGENHTSHDLSEQGCEYSPGVYRFCEYAILNKANTHESRVHHVETPGGIQNLNGFKHVDVGFVWITELAYQINNGNTAVTGMSGPTIGSLGIPTPASDASVNQPITYSLALLATSKNEKRGSQFIEFLRAAEGQTPYTDGGFTGLTADELDMGKCYSKPVDGASVPTDRTGPGSCKDWLKNGSF